MDLWWLERKLKLQSQLPKQLLVNNRNRHCSIAMLTGLPD